jgi:hypothetical protein
MLKTNNLVGVKLLFDDHVQIICKEVNMTIELDAMMANGDI